MSLLSFAVCSLLSLSLSSPLTLSQASAERARPPWAKARTPSEGVPMSVGTYAEGCLQGGVALKASATGLRSVRRQRGRFYGHPELIESLYLLGERAAERGLQPLLVGDLSQPRGGLMSYGHRSHQMGLDADVWFSPLLTRTPSVVTGADERLNTRVWSQRHEVALELAASLPRVERIFVHWRIKELFCQRDPIPAWSHKLRPWFGHDKHFHLRLFCPEGSPSCEPQAPLKEGDPGCDPKHLTWFSLKERRARARADKEAAQRPRPPLSPEEREAQREARRARAARSARRAQACEHLTPRASSRPKRPKQSKQSKQSKRRRAR